MFRKALIILATMGSAALAEEVPQSRADIAMSFAPVVRQAAPAVVNIYAKQLVAERRSPFAGDPFFEQFFGDLGRGQPRLKNSLGSGVILDPAGLVVSNYHVVANATDIRVVLSDRREFNGKIVLADQRADLAVIRLDEAGELPVLALGDSAALEVGDLVLAIGNPFGVGQTVSSGIVSGLARTGLSGPRFRGGAYFIQTDAPINPGNSGGALVDMAGRLIGINTSILTRSGGSNGIGFAIPSNLVAQYVEQARQGRTEFARPWAGMQVQAVDASLSEALGQGVPTGVLVAELHSDSSFSAAGLKIGDVILSVDGIAVYTQEEMAYHLAVAGIGQDIALEVQRADGRTDIRVSLAEAPGAPAPGTLPGPTVQNGRFGGVTVADLTPWSIARFGLPIGIDGAVVVGIASGTNGGGLQPGDVIRRVNRAAIADAEALAKALSERTNSWRIDLIRGGRRLNLRLRG